MELSIRNKISDDSSHARVIEPWVLGVVPLVVIPPPRNFIEINDNSNSRRSFDDGGNESRGP